MRTKVKRQIKMVVKYTQSIMMAGYLDKSGSMMVVTAL